MDKVNKQELRRLAEEAKNGELVGPYMLAMPDDVLSLLDELDDADDLQRVLNLKTEKIVALNDAVADLSEKLEQYRKDAERWRYVRDKQTFIWLVQEWFKPSSAFIDVDSLIDQAKAVCKECGDSGFVAVGGECDLCHCQGHQAKEGGANG